MVKASVPPATRVQDASLDRVFLEVGV